MTRMEVTIRHDSNSVVYTRKQNNAVALVKNENKISQYKHKIAKIATENKNFPPKRGGGSNSMEAYK